MVGSSLTSWCFIRGYGTFIHDNNPEHVFYPNQLKRYALGTKNKSLKYNPDGSLTIYLGNQSPGADKESNWLPAPSGNFSIWLRAYWPDQAVLDATWKPPVISRTVQ
jgi:hypothetical protein